MTMRFYPVIIAAMLAVSVMAPALTPQTAPTDAEAISLLKRLVDDAGKYAGIATDDGGDIQLQNWRDMFFKNGI